MFNCRFFAWVQDVLYERIIILPFAPSENIHFINIAEVEPVNGWAVSSVAWVNNSHFEIQLEQWREDLTEKDLGTEWNKV